MLQPRELVTLTYLTVPKVGLAINPATRFAYRDGKRIGRVVGFAPLKPDSSHGWLRIDTDELPES